MIKNFIYLDEQKMYSLSSQIFEGISEYILNENFIEEQGSESQKGPFSSGRVLAEVIKTNRKSTEKKFLNDYSFTLFERHLEQEGRILDLTKSNTMSLDEIKSSINSYSFIKVKARAQFNDIEKITELFNEFNRIGEALAHMGAMDQIEEQNILKRDLDNLKKQSKDRNNKSQIDILSKKLHNFNITELAKEQNLYQDPGFLKSLILLTKYGFSDQFEIQQYGGEVIYTSCLQRDFLRENADILVKKYARKTEKEVVVFGMVTQSFLAFEPPVDSELEPHNLKGGLMSMVEHLANIENSISGKQENEVVIDPIAAYFEV